MSKDLSSNLWKRDLTERSIPWSAERSERDGAYRVVMSWMYPGAWLCTAVHVYVVEGHYTNVQVDCLVWDRLHIQSYVLECIELA